MSALRLLPVAAALWLPLVAAALETGSPAAVIAIVPGDDAAAEEQWRAADEAAARAAADPACRLIIEARSDDRGSRELNLAMAQRRLDQIEQRLLARGVASYRIRSVNYGEEMAGEGAPAGGLVAIRLRTSAVQPSVVATVEPVERVDQAGRGRDQQQRPE